MDQKKKNEKSNSCPCYSKSCPRHGICVECIKYHHACGTKTCCGK